MRPIIAYTCSEFQSIFVKFTLKIAIILAGGKPVAILSKHDSDNMQFDGLLLAGGVDIHPGLYKGKVKEHYLYDKKRDGIELTLLKRAFANNKPILGICRGCQMLNIFREGTLYEDVSQVDGAAKYPSRLWGNIFYRKHITIIHNSKLYACINKKHTQVNSIHKQCINLVGKNLQVSATEKNGIIQGIEDKDRNFVIGVQFHPEFLIYRKSFFNLFKNFIKATKKTFCKMSN